MILQLFPKVWERPPLAEPVESGLIMFCQEFTGDFIMCAITVVLSATSKQESEAKAELWNCIKGGQNFSEHSNAINVIKDFVWQRILYVCPKD